MVSGTWIAKVDGHEIKSTNSWTGGAKLYIDGECRDTDKRVFADPKEPLLSARLVAGDIQSPLVEVYFKSALFSVLAKIHVDGKRVAGDDF